MGALTSIAVVIMFTFIIREEHIRTHNCRALYVERFENKPESRDIKLKAIAEELTLSTGTKFWVHGKSMFNRERQIVMSFSEAIGYLETSREHAFI